MSGAGIDRAALHAPFRPRRARLVAWGLAGLQFAVLTAVALAQPTFGPADRISMIATAVLIAWAVSRFALTSAIPSETGLRVRNVVTVRYLEWAQIVAVRLAPGDPWAMLDLSDGNTLAVLAIQGADGEHGRAEARRLATLVALHSAG